MYIDYTFYKDSYGGVITELEFTLLNVKAQAKVDYFTFNRIPKLYPLPETVKYCVCEVIDCIHEHYVTKEAEDKRISSETVGSHSVTYKYGDEINKAYKKTLDQKIYEICATYLMNGQDLMYRGMP